jgi:GNAT superfamily N-acetyltransferase
MGTSLLALRRAAPHDIGVIFGLIDEAARWLRVKGTDQWAQPWPSREGRDRRILAGLRQGKTWIVWADTTPAGTITVDPEPNPVWPERERQEKAIYVCRLVVSRRHGGIGLGAELLDWAGRSAIRDHGALWLRVDVWTTNYALHSYYEQQGFRFHALCANPHYPSGALFQKPTDQAWTTSSTLFKEVRSPEHR